MENNQIFTPTMSSEIPQNCHTALSFRKYQDVQREIDFVGQGDFMEQLIFKKNGFLIPDFCYWNSSSSSYGDNNEEPTATRIAISDPPVNSKVKVLPHLYHHVESYI